MSFTTWHSMARYPAEAFTMVTRPIMLKATYHRGQCRRQIQDFRGERRYIGASTSRGVSGTTPNLRSNFLPG